MRNNNNTARAPHSPLALHPVISAFAKGGISENCRFSARAPRANRLCALSRTVKLMCPRTRARARPLLFGPRAGNFLLVAAWLFASSDNVRNDSLLETKEKSWLRPPPFTVILACVIDCFETHLYLYYIAGWQIAQHLKYIGKSHFFPDKNPSQFADSFWSVLWRKMEIHLFLLFSLGSLLFWTAGRFSIWLEGIFSHTCVIIRQEYYRRLAWSWPSQESWTRIGHHAYACGWWHGVKCISRLHRRRERLMGIRWLPRVTWINCFHVL